MGAQRLSAVKSICTPSPKPHKKLSRRSSWLMFTNSAKAMSGAGDELKENRSVEAESRIPDQRQKRTRVGIAGAVGVRSGWGSLKKGHLFLCFQPQGRSKIPPRN